MPTGDAEQKSLAELLRPAWNPQSARPGSGFHEVWYLKLNSTDGRRALWLRFTILMTKNGFKRVSETWGILFERKPDGEIEKTALKETHELRDFTGAEASYRIGRSAFSESATRGEMRSKGRILKWDLEFENATAGGFDFVPEGLRKSGIVKNMALTVAEDLRFNGICEIDGRRIEWKNAHGMMGHLAGDRHAHSWSWAHCNTFTDQDGKPAPFVFDGLTARVRLPAGIRAPRLSSIFLRYFGKDYRFNSLWQAVRLRSEASLTEWKFQADHKDLSFRGHIEANLRDFAGVTYEDTDSSFLYCSNSKLSRMTVLVYRAGKLESTLTAAGTAAFEVVTRDKNPYVPILI